MDAHEEDAENQPRAGQSSMVSECPLTQLFRELIVTKGAFIYQPNSKVHDGRPTKKRKISKPAPPAHRETSYTPFQPLLNGKETESLVKLRLDTFRKLWSEQEGKIQVCKESSAVVMLALTGGLKIILQDIDAGILEDVSSFITSTTVAWYVRARSLILLLKLIVYISGTRIEFPQL